MEIAHRPFVVTLAALLILFADVSAGQQVSSSLDHQPLLLPPVALAPGDGEADEKSETEAVARRAAELARLAVAAADPVTRCDLHLAAANWILARRIEPACSQYLLHLDRPGAAETIRQALPNVDRLLEAAQASIRQAEERGTQTPQDWMSRSRRHLMTLETFVEAFRAALSEPDSPNYVEDRRAARSRLAILLEHDEPQIPAAAMLWCLELADPDADPKRVMRDLPLVLEEPSPAALPHAFYVRLARCRLIADGGGYTTAVALLMQLEERCAEWFRGDDADNALRTCVLVELQILRQWRDSLIAAGRQQERAWCERRFKKLVETHFTAVINPVLRLGSVIPMLIELPDENIETPPSPPENAPSDTGQGGTG